MKDPRCINCKCLKVCRNENVSWVFIIIGFISTVAIRLVTILMSLSPAFGKTAWYIGVTGFCIFFVYKFKVFKNRSKMIDNNNLLEKINSQVQLSEYDYSVLSDILCSIRSNRERVNFLFIFIVSSLALIVAIYFDFIAS